MNLNHKSRLIWASIIVAWIFDLLFWKQAPGISYLIMVVLVIAAGLILAFGEKLPPAKGTWLLAPVILFFAGMTFFRSEPFSMFIGMSFSSAFLALAAVTFLGGQWWNYSFSDYIVKFFHLAISTLSRFMMFLSQKSPSESDLPGEPAPTKKTAPTWAIVRGLVIALPIVLVLAVLLGSADPIFNEKLQAILKIFNIERLGEYLFRLFYILVLAYLLAGAYLNAFTQSRDEKLLGIEKPWMAPFLGWVEAIIILAAIDALFAVFVGIQFKYFFGGQVNIHLDGYTYAEYARKGFFELIAVAVISLLILQVLSSITRRLLKKEGSAFSGLSVGLVVLVVIILVSAFQRLQLYESAYGFSRIRIYSHILMIWLGVLLVATVLIEILRRQRLFPLAIVVSLIGFGATITLINVDQFIVRENIARSQAGQELDVAYLVSLSDDAVPYLAQEYKTTQAGQQLHAQLGTVLACKLDTQQTDDTNHLAAGRKSFWGSYQWSSANARTALDGLASELTAAFPLHKEEAYLRYTIVDGIKYSCESDTMH
jgi:hypothetical protein